MYKIELTIWDGDPTPMKEIDHVVATCKRYELSEHPRARGDCVECLALSLTVDGIEGILINHEERVEKNGH